jgi:hypothetical protein
MLETDTNWKRGLETYNACLTPPWLLMNAVVGSAAGVGNPVTRPTRVCSALKGTQENNRRTATPAMAAKYGMAKNNCSNTNQSMWPAADRGRVGEEDLSDKYGKTRSNIH